MKARKPRARPAAGAKAAPVDSPRDWGALIGEAVTLALIVIVPIAINPASENRNDIKDAALGLGVAAALAVWLLLGLRRGVLRWAASPLTPAVFAYALWAAATIVLARYRYAAIGEFGRLAAHIGLFFLLLTYLRGLPQVRRLAGAACLAAMPVCGYGFYQALTKTTGTSSGRVYSFLGNPTFLASFLILVLPLAVAAALGGRRGSSRFPRLLFLAAALVMAACFYLTVSFSPAIGAVLGLLAAGVLAVVRGGRRAVRRLGLAALVAAVLLVPPGWHAYRHLSPANQERVQSLLSLRDPAGAERHLHWRVAADLFREHPIGGIGYGVYRVEALERLSAPWYAQRLSPTSEMLLTQYAHNELLQVLADTGLVGAALFMIMLTLGYWSAIRLSLRSAERAWRCLGLAAVVALTAFLVQNQFGVTFYQTGAVTFFWLWLAVLAVGAAGLPPAADPAGQSGEGAPHLRRLHFAPLAAPGLLVTALLAAGALAMLAWVVVTPMRANVAVHSARAAEAQRAWPEEARFAQQAADLCPYSAAAFFLGGNAWDSLGDQQKAVASYERALSLQPGIGMVEYNAGLSRERLGQLDRAEAHYRRAAALMPMVAQHHASLATVLAGEKRFREAEVEFRQAAACNPASAQIYLAQARLAAEGKSPATAASVTVSAFQQRAQALLIAKNYGSALGACARWAQVEPRSPDAFGSLGVCQFQLGRFAEAEQSFRRVLALRPNDQQALYSLAITCERQGKAIEARQLLEQVVKLDPGTSFGVLAKQRLAQ